MFYLIENVVEWHKDSVVKPISILCQVEEMTVVPHFMNTFCNCCRPHLPDNFVETNRSHMLEIVTTSYLACQFDDFISKPTGTCASRPDMIHVFIYETTYSWVPSFEHVGGCLR